jgi:hypothetical protein
VTRFTNLTTGGPAHADVRHGKTVRVVPLQFEESDGPPWTMPARGRTFTAVRRAVYYRRCMNLAGFCSAEHDPGSWKGRRWGGMHMWGFSHKMGIPERHYLPEDALKNTKAFVSRTADPKTSGGGIYFTPSLQED